MAEESQVSPLAPASIYRRSDEEFAAVKPKNKHQKKSSKCFVYLFTGFVLQCIAMLVFSLVVFRFKSPQIRLNSVVSVKNLRHVTSPWPSINVTVVAEVGVKNKNFGRFEFEETEVAVMYQDVRIGGAKINRGRARARKTERVKVSLEVRSKAFLAENWNFSGDLNSGLVKLRSYAKVVGRVQVLKIINKQKRSEMNCTMSLNLTSKAIQDLRCM